jgi:peptidoglycan/xylan/chitin deacetylase (PgdA/CDA1 family)
MKIFVKNMAVALLSVICGVSAASESGYRGTTKGIQYKQKNDSLKGKGGERLPPGTIVRGDEIKGSICFTFDDGPDYRTTPVLLDQLDRHGIKAAFFINGAKIHSSSVSGEENRVVLREIASRGHIIGNHTFSHKDIKNLTEEEWNKEIRQVERLVNSSIGQAEKIFRPPFGSMGHKEFIRITRDGYNVIMWNIDPMDWKANNARQIMAGFRNRIEENPQGGIVVMHDTNRSAIEAFPLIIEWIEERNSHRRATGEFPLQVVGIHNYFK